MRAMTSNIGCLTLITAALTGCNPAGSPRPEDAAATRPSETQPQHTDVSRRPSALEEARTSVTVHMPDHLSHATVIRDAVVMGHLERAKPPAKYLAEHWPEQVLETWLPFVRGLRHSAGEVDRASDLVAASRGAASMALACGQCHQALDDGPTFPTPPAPPAGDDAGPRMQRHRWAADRLWEGVVQPSAERWTEGVEGLQELPNCQDDHGGEQLSEVVEAARTATEKVRSQANDATDLPDRARLYGELIVTCSSCHLAGC